MSGTIGFDVDETNERYEMIANTSPVVGEPTEVEMNGPTTTHCTACHETFDANAADGYSYTSCPVDSLGYGTCPGCNTSQDGSGEWALMVGAIEPDEMDARCDNIDACKRADRIYWAN